MVSRLTINMIMMGRVKEEILKDSNKNLLQERINKYKDTKSLLMLSSMVITSFIVNNKLIRELD